MRASHLWFLFNLLLVISVFAAGIFVGHRITNQPKAEVIYRVAPSGDFDNVVMRLTTGDGTAYSYECDMHLVTGVGSTAACEWPDPQGDP